MAVRLCLVAIVLMICLATLLAGPPDDFWGAPADASALANPYEGKLEHARAGAKLFRQSCASCHGQQAEGKGKYPALTSGRVRGAQPGALFWFIRKGSLGNGMPSFARLPEERVWQIVTYLQAGPVPSH